MLFTFPSRYLSTIGLTGVFSLAGRARQIHAGFLVSRATQDTARGRLASPTGLSPSVGTLSRVFRSPRALPSSQSYNPGRRLDGSGLGSSPFARRYSGNHCCFLFLRVLRCFSSPRSPRTPIKHGDGCIAAGLPHSDTPGSQAVCAFPGIFAACRVLRRLREPRHPPCALLRFSRSGILHLGKCRAPHTAGVNRHTACCSLLHANLLSPYIFIIYGAETRESCSLACAIVSMIDCMSSSFREFP